MICNYYKNNSENKTSIFFELRLFNITPPPIMQTMSVLATLKNLFIICGVKGQNELIAEDPSMNKARTNNNLLELENMQDLAFGRGRCETSHIDLLT